MHTWCAVIRRAAHANKPDMAWHTLDCKNNWDFNGTTVVVKFSDDIVVVVIAFMMLLPGALTATVVPVSWFTPNSLIAIFRFVVSIRFCRESSPSIESSTDKCLNCTKLVWLSSSVKIPTTKLVNQISIKQRVALRSGSQTQKKKFFSCATIASCKLWKC